jgi:hypothetical protein
LPVGLGVGLALVEVRGDHADRADLAGAGDREPSAAMA